MFLISCHYFHFLLQLLSFRSEFRWIYLYKIWFIDTSTPTKRSCSQVLNSSLSRGFLHGPCVDDEKVDIFQSCVVADQDGDVGSVFLLSELGWNPGLIDLTGVFFDPCFSTQNYEQTFLFKLFLMLHSCFSSHASLLAIFLSQTGLFFSPVCQLSDPLKAPALYNILTTKIVFFLCRIKGYVC